MVSKNQQIKKKILNSRQICQKTPKNRQNRHVNLPNGGFSPHWLFFAKLVDFEIL